MLKIIAFALLVFVLYEVKDNNFEFILEKNSIYTLSQVHKHIDSDK